MNIELGSKAQLANARGFKRYSDLILSFSNYDATAKAASWQLLGTQESDVPLKLATGSVGAPIINVAINERYMAFLANEGRPVVYFYDLDNIYAPKLVSL